MLVIRMQRTGRHGHAQFRVVVQDSRRTPTSGKVVAQLGHYDPHSKQTVIDKEKVQFYLDHGAQPSPRVVRLLKSEGVKLPAWVATADQKTKSTKSPDKLRKNRPAEEAPAETGEPEAAPAADASAESSAEATEAVVEPSETDEPATEANTDESKAEQS